MHPISAGIQMADDLLSPPETARTFVFSVIFLIILQKLQISPWLENREEKVARFVVISKKIIGRYFLRPFQVTHQLFIKVKEEMNPLLLGAVSGSWRGGWVTLQPRL